MLVIITVTLLILWILVCSFKNVEFWVVEWPSGLRHCLGGKNVEFYSGRLFNINKNGPFKACY